MKRIFYRAGSVACAAALVISACPMTVWATAPDEPAMIQTSAEETAETTEAAEETGVTEADVDAWFEDTVFVGDSVMQGFRNYAAMKKDTWLGKPQFLASVSYSLYSCMKAPGYKLHPVYAGQKRQVWESIAMMGAKKVFLFFGLNDINITGINGTRDYYVKVVDQIKALSPDVQIYLMSMTNTVAGRRSNNLYNDNIRKYNATMQQLAAEQGWGFVDVATPLTDANGDLIASYCSDKDVHLTNAAYAIWATVLRNYARSQLEAQLAAEEAAKEEAESAKTAGPGSAAGSGAAGSAAGPGSSAKNEPSAGKAPESGSGNGSVKTGSEAVPGGPTAQSN